LNVLLIYPEYPDTFWGFKHALRFVEKKAVLPPLGLLTVAALSPTEWQKKLVDLNVRSLTNADLQWADLAMVSAMAVQRDSAASVIDLCHDAGLPIIAGGPLFLTEYERFPNVDTFVLGEGEDILPQLAEDIRHGKQERIYRSGQFPNIERSPIPSWELLDFRRYNQMSVQFSRGCPYDCDFCDVTVMFGRRLRMKSVPQILAELDRIYALRWRQGIFVADDNFIGNHRFVKSELLPALIKWRKGKEEISFNTQTTINLADDPELMQLMVQAGIHTVFIGIESPEEQSLEECHKVQNMNRDLLQSVKIIQKAGIQIQGGFIVGFDHDPPSIFQRMVDFIQQSGIVVAMVGLLEAFPGTKLYKRLKEENRLRNLPPGDNVCGWTNVIPKMGELLMSGYQYILKQLYSPPNFYQRIRTFLMEYRPPHYKVRFDLRVIPRYCRATLRVIGHLGFASKERSHFWRLFWWVLLTRPRLLPLAMTLAAYGVHFRKICELYIGHPTHEPSYA